MTLAEAELQLCEVASSFHTRKVEMLKEVLAQSKTSAVAKGDQAGAKRIWCLEGILAVQQKYVEAFDDLFNGHFYAGWCAFERVEIEYSFLRRHLPQPHSAYRLDFIVSKTHQWQSLYPYRLFSSMEFIKKARKCMICNQPVSLRKPCGHLIGEIYDGEMCCHEITEIDWTSISLVTNPHHKYTVIFVQGEDRDSNTTGRFDPLIHVIKRLESPFDEWQAYHGKRAISREEFRGRSRYSLCPCGEMDDFGDCCFDKSQIVVPWVHIEFGEVQNHQIPDFLILDSLQKTSSICGY
jgi:hypothetical protein